MSMGALEIILIGVVMLGGMAWLYHLLSEGEHHRLVPTLIVGAIILLGVGAREGIALADSRSNVHFVDFCAAVGKAFLFAVGINLKSFLGPLVVALTISFSVYYLFEYGEMRSLPILSTLIDLVFGAAPPWVECLYCVSMGLYSAAGSVHDHIFA